MQKSEPPFSLSNKVALVTGSGRGLGRGIALTLAGAGANVVVSDVSRSAAQPVAEEIQQLGGNAISVAMDVTSSASITQGLEQLLSRYSQIDVLVNNAGVMQKGFGENTTAEDFDRCYDVNLKGAWQVSRALAPMFKKQGQGKIVNIASMAGRRGHALSPAYCASKAAVISLTQALASELGEFNVNVNAVCPGLIWTPMWQEIEANNQGVDQLIEERESESFKGSIEMTVLKRPQSASDIGNAVVFLASEASCNITGQSINIDGGIFMN